MAKLKFGSPAWRKKYMGKAKRKRNSGYPTQFRATFRGEYLGSYDTKAEANRAIAAARREYKKEQAYFSGGYPPQKPKKRKNTPRKKKIRSNPPRKWTKVKAVRVVRKGGKDVLEIRK